MAVLQSQLRLSLIDGISAAAKRIQASLAGVGRSAAGVKAGGFGSAIAASADRASRNVVALQAKLVAATAGAYALGRAMKGVVSPTANFETTLLDIAQKADMSDTAMAGLGTRIRGIAKDVGRGAGEMAKGMDVLLGMGMNAPDAEGIIPTIGRAASAYRAEIEDLSKASMAAMDNLRVRVDEMPRALDAMARSGKEGAFELNDQARYFASLASLGQTLKLKGVDGVAEISSALQVIRKGSGTSEEAATRLSDVFGKITSQETIKKFGKLGIDIQKSLKKAQVQAEKTGKPFSAIDFVVENLNKALKGDVGRIGEIFQDKEARLGAIALMQYHAEFQRIRRTSLEANGEVSKDFARRAKTFDAVMIRFKAAAEDLAITLGSRVLPTISDFFGTISGLLNSLDGRVSVFDQIGKAVAGLMNGLGLTDGSTFTQALSSLRDMLFGTVEAFEGDTDRLAQIFKRFQEFGASLRGFADAITSVISAIAGFVGVDSGALLSFLGTLATYGAGLALTATALGLVAKSVMGVGKAMLFLSGIKTATGIIKSLAGLAGGSAGTGAAGAAGAAVAGSKGIAGRLGRIGRFARGAGAIGGGIAAYGAVRSVTDGIDHIRDETVEKGLHSAPNGDGAAKLAEYKREIGEIEATLDRLREKSRDPDTFAIANQAAIRRLEELKAAATNLAEDIAKQTPPTATEMPSRGWSPKTPPALTGPTVTAPLPPSRPPDLRGLDAAKAKATEVSEAVGEINTTVKPSVDTGSLREALSYAQALRRELAQIPGLVSTAGRSVGRGRSEFATATANLRQSRLSNAEGRNAYDGPGRGHA